MTQAGTYYNQMAVRPEATVRPVVINWHVINHLPSNLDVHLYVRCVYTCPKSHLSGSHPKVRVSYATTMGGGGFVAMSEPVQTIYYSTP